MVFPTIPTAGAGRVLTNVQANTTATRTFPSLSSLTKNSGDRLIAICVAYQSSAAAGAVFSGWTGGFTERADLGGSTSNMSVGVAELISAGTETGTFAVTQAATITGHSVQILLSIAGAHASTAIEVSAIAHGTAAAADPAALDPAGWAAEDTLWIVVAGSGETATTGSFTGLGATPPTNYGNHVLTGISQDAVGGAEGGVAFRQLNASSENVGTWSSVDVSNARNSALLIAVRPAEAATFERSAAVTATAAIATSGTFFSILEAAASVAATGAVTTAGEVTHVFSRSAAVSATGQIATTGRRDLLRSSAVSGVGAIQVAGQRDLLRSSSLAAAGLIATGQQRDLHRSASLSATGTISSTGLEELARAVSLAATGSISTSGQIEGTGAEFERSASLQATTTIATTASFWTTFERVVALSATGAITTTIAGRVRARWRLRTADSRWPVRPRL